MKWIENVLCKSVSSQGLLLPVYNKVIFFYNPQKRWKSSPTPPLEREFALLFPAHLVCTPRPNFPPTTLNIYSCYKSIAYYYAVTFLEIPINTGVSKDCKRHFRGYITTFSWVFSPKITTFSWI